MSDKKAKAIDILEKAIDDKIAKAAPSSKMVYSAQVSNIDSDGTTWVRILGSDEDTPVTETTAVYKPGDAVSVRIENGVARIVGNYSQPAVGESDVKNIFSKKIYPTVHEEIGDATKAGAAAERAAAEAAAVAEAVNQHFWYRDTDPGDTAGAGAFVTDESQEDFLDAIEQGLEPTEQRPLHNLLMNSEGILLRAAKKWFASFTHSTVTFFDGLGNGVNNIVAQFGANLARIGKASGKHVDITSSGVDMLDGDNSIAQFTPTSARLGEVRYRHLTLTTSSFGLYPPNSNQSNDAYIYQDSSGMRVGQRIDGASNITIKPGDFSLNIGTSAMGKWTYLASQSSIAKYMPGLLADGTYDAINFKAYTVSYDPSSSNPGYSTPNPTIYKMIANNVSIAANDSGFYAGWTDSNYGYAASMFSPTAGLLITRGLRSGSTSGDFIFSATKRHIDTAPLEISLRTSGLSREGAFLDVRDGDANGSAVILGAGGLTIIGGGEAANNLYAALGLAATNESLHLGADGTVYVHSNCNTVANRKTWSFNTDGSLTLPSGSKLGSMATLSGLTTTAKSGSAKNSSQVAANGTTTIPVTIDAPDGHVLQCITQISCNTWSLVSCGYQTSNYNTPGASMTFNTYWRNVTGTAVAANAATVTVAAVFIKKSY